MKNVRLHGAGAASGHKERGGLQDIADVALQAGLGLHVLAVQLVQGVSQVLPELLFEELRAGEVLRQALAQFFLVAAVSLPTPSPTAKKAAKAAGKRRKRKALGGRSCSSPCW